MSDKEEHDRIVRKIMSFGIGMSEHPDLQVAVEKGAELPDGIEETIQAEFKKHWPDLYNGLTTLTIPATAEPAELLDKWRK